MADQQQSDTGSPNETGQTQQKDAPEQTGQQPGGSGLLVIILLWLAVIYFFFMRPKQKKEKERRNQIESIRKGDKITTIGGIHGTVVKIDEKTITLRVDERKDVQMKFARAAVHEVESKDGGESKPQETTEDSSEEDGRAPMPGE
jgi:preprotein translocase subunit YajC